MNKINRRQFLKSAVAAGTFPYIAKCAWGRTFGPGDKVRLACVGIGQQAWGDIRNFANTKLVEIAGPDGKFKPAAVVNKSHKGNYSGKELVVKADGVAQPRAIRYLYSKPWIGSLYSADSGLPLAPFELRITEGD